jgi:hypothetical protein
MSLSHNLLPSKVGLRVYGTTLSFPLHQGGVGVAEKDRGSFFLETPRRGGLSKYVIRGISIFGTCITL